MTITIPLWVLNYLVICFPLVLMAVAYIADITDGYSHGIPLLTFAAILIVIGWYVGAALTYAALKYG